MNRLLSIVPTAFLLALPLGACAQAPVAPAPQIEEIPCIVVTGHGEASGRPDRATARIGAVAQAKDAASAQNQVNQTTAKAIQQLRSLGIPEEAMQTQGLDLSPEYTATNPAQQAEPRISSYRATSTLEIRIDDLTKIGPVIDAAVGAGANQIQGVTFELKNDLGQRQNALRSAAQQARSKAEAIAQAIGVALGPIQEVQEQGAARTPIPYGVAPRVAFDMAQTPVQPGQLTVTADLTVRYRIIAPK